MSTFGFRSRFLTLGALLALGATGSPLFAQTPPKVALKEIVDDRYGGGKTEGGLVVVLELAGSDLESYPAGRAFLKAATDDSGRSLLPKKPAEPSFSDLKFSSGLRLDLVSPPRGSRSVTVSGTVELFAPKKDPAAVVKVPKALKKLDVPLDAPGLRAAKLQVTPLSEARYAEEQKKQESPEAKERFRKQMKAEGMSDEEIEAAFELRAAFKELGSRTLITKGTLTGVVDRLAARGLVERAASPDDGRSTIVRLTAEGERVFREVFEPHLAFLAPAVESLPECGRKDLEKRLRQLREALEKRSDELARQ